MLTDIIILALGLAVLTIAADLLIKCSVKTAMLLRLSTVFIGLVLVSFGTSTPELTVSSLASLKGLSDIAVANVVGSNISNIALVLGLCGVIMPMKTDKTLLRLEMPAMLAASFLLLVLGLDRTLSRIDGIILLAVFTVFMVMSIKKARVTPDGEAQEEFSLKGYLARTQSVPAVTALSLLSLAILVGSSYFIVDSAKKLSLAIGLSEWFVGVTIVAVGTSLPELAASFTASIKKLETLSVINIVGSNIFNILFILGVAALICPLSIAPTAKLFDIPAMCAIAVALWAVAWKSRLSRPVCGAFLLSYAGYVLIMAEIQ